MKDRNEERQLYGLIVNAMLLSRQSLINSTMLDPKGRDLDRECGYPVGEMGADFYWKLYQSVGIANRVVNVYPSECWSICPDLYEQEDDALTPFEERWKAINEDNRIWSYLDRIDELSGIGSFGVLFMGLADGGRPDTPAPGVGEDGRSTGQRVENELLFMRTYDQSNVKVTRFQTDFNNPRYGLPLEYKLDVTTPVQGTFATEEAGVAYTRGTITAHWSRVLHVADNRKSSEVFGMPRMRAVLPEIFDIRKIRGGSAEMFWRGAFPGYSFETHPELGIEADFDKESLREEFENYSNGLQRYMALQGITAKPLSPQISEPGNHLDEQYRSIGATIGVPLRILMGSESGHLASTQDSGTWNRRLGKRQNLYITPHIIKPFVQRLMLTGCLPTVDRFKVDWNDLNTLTAKDKVDIALKRTQCLMSYVTGQCEQVMPLLEYFVNVMGLTIEEGVAILKKVKRKNRKFITTPVNVKPEPQGGGRNNGDEQGDQGNPGTSADGSPNT